MRAAQQDPAQALRGVVGPRDARGRYLVMVDARPAGHVLLRRRIWWAWGLGDSNGSEHHSRTAAVAGLVRLVDCRSMAAAELARRMARRTEAPVGWMLKTWAEVSPGSVVRTPGVCRRVDSGLPDGLLYPEDWGARVRLTRVERLSNGCILAHGTSGTSPAWGGMGVLLSTPAYSAIGVLVPRFGA